MSRKLICLVLAVCMVMGLALTGCKSGETAATTAAASSAAATSAAASAEATTAAGSSAADTTAAPAASGWDTGSIEVEPLGIDLGGADLQFICHIGLNDARTPVWEKGGQYIAETYNGGEITLTLCDSAEYDSKVKTTLASGMAADVIYTSNGNGFTEFVSSEAFMPLDDYIASCMPNAYAKVPEALYKAVTFNGSIYAIIPFKDLVENNSLLYDKSQADAAGVDLQGWTRWSDNVENFYKLREYADKDESRKDIPVSCFYDNWGREAVLEVIGTRAACIGANYATVETVAGYKPYTDLFVVYDCPEFNAWVKTLNQQVTDRILPYDRSNYDKDNVNRNSGKQIVWSSQGYVFAPDSIVDYECTLAPQAISTGYTGYTCGALNAVNAATENPEAACKLIEILSCDKYIGTILRFGEEGVHWTMNADGQADCTIGLDTKIKYWYGVQLGDITNCILPTDVQPTFHDALETMNNNAIFSENMGFNVDSTPVEAEVAAVSAVHAEYMTSTNIVSGMLTEEETDARIAEFLEKIKANGVEKILTEYQTQLDAWRSANG